MVRLVEAARIARASVVIGEVLRRLRSQGSWRDWQDGSY